MTITVYGLPGPQGSKKPMGRDRKGRTILLESSKKVKPWREAVKWAAIEAGGRVAGPVEVDMTFSLPRPKSAPKRVRLPATRPDLSKLVRSTEDALTDAGAWEDDGRVVECRARKVFAGSRMGAALDRPGVVIVITEAVR